MYVKLAKAENTDHKAILCLENLAIPSHDVNPVILEYGFILYIAAWFITRMI